MDSSAILIISIVYLAVSVGVVAVIVADARCIIRKGRRLIWSDFKFWKK
jgi:hypothetical protein